MLLGAAVTRESKQEEISMKTKRLLFISCLAAGALNCFAFIWQTGKEIRRHVAVKAKRVAPQTTQVMRTRTIKTLVLAWAHRYWRNRVTLAPLLRGPAI
jgi:hypothetical protein